MKIVLVIISMLGSLFFFNNSVNERTSCYFKETDEYVEMYAEFPKSKNAGVFEIVNKHTNNVFNLSSTNCDINKTETIATNFKVSIKTTNKKVSLKSTKTQNSKDKLKKLHEELNQLLN